MKRVALIGENSTEYVSALLDIWNNDECAVLIDWRIPFPRIIEMIKEADVKKCYIEKDKYTDSICVFPYNVEVILYDRKAKTAQLLPQYIYDKYRNKYSDDEAVVIYSSGTTGLSKGIILSHYAIQMNADAIIDYMSPTRDDCLYIVKVISHSSTLTGELLVALKSHMKAVIAPTIVPPRVMFSNIEKFKTTIICLNPTLLLMLSDEVNRRAYNFSSLRTIYVSGSILNEKIYKKAHNAFVNIPIYNVYGLSEAGPRVSAQGADCCKSNSVGRPIKYVNVAIIDESGKIVPQGHRGIVHVNTPSVFSNYVLGNRSVSLYNPDWLNTRDIGFFDINGELHIVGRVDDLIIIESHKIYPSEVEQEILLCGAINECVVTKVDYNESEFLVCLYTGEKRSETVIRESLRDKLSTYEIPKRFIHCNSIPRTLNRKTSTTEIKNIIIQEMRNHNAKYKE